MNTAALTFAIILVAASVAMLMALQFGGPPVRFF